MLVHQMSGPPASRTLGIAPPMEPSAAQLAALLLGAAAPECMEEGTPPDAPAASPAALPAGATPAATAAIPAPAAAVPDTDGPAPKRKRGKINYVAKSKKGVHGAIRYFGRQNGEPAWLEAHLRAEECMGMDGMPLTKFELPAEGQVVEFAVVDDAQGPRAVMITGSNLGPVLLRDGAAE